MLAGKPSEGAKNLEPKKKEKHFVKMKDTLTQKTFMTASEIERAKPLRTNPSMCPQPRPKFRGTFGPFGDIENPVAKSGVGYFGVFWYEKKR